MLHSRQQHIHYHHHANDTLHFATSKHHGTIIRKLTNSQLNNLVFGQQSEHFEWSSPRDYHMCKVLYGWRLTGLPLYSPIPKYIDNDTLADVSYLECLVHVPKCNANIVSPYVGCTLKQVPTTFLKRVVDVSEGERGVFGPSFYADCKRMYGYRLANVVCMRK